MLIDSQPEIMLLGKKESGQPLNAFIVDDSITVIKLLGRMLTDFGVNTVGSAGNGKEAIALLTTLQGKETIDLITLDITMPVMDGMEALPTIVKLFPAAQVIMVSALGDKNRVLQAVSLGAKYYIVKPFQKASVFQCLYKVFNRH